MCYLFVSYWDIKWCLPPKSPPVCLTFFLSLCLSSLIRVAGLSSTPCCWPFICHRAQTTALSLSPPCTYLYSILLYVPQPRSSVWIKAGYLLGLMVMCATYHYINVYNYRLQFHPRWVLLYLGLFYGTHNSQTYTCVCVCLYVCVCVCMCTCVFILCALMGCCTVQLGGLARQKPVGHGKSLFHRSFSGLCHPSNYSHLVSWWLAYTTLSRIALTERET